MTIKSKFDLFDFMADILVEVIPEEANIFSKVKIDDRFNVYTNPYVSKLSPFLGKNTFNIDVINVIVSQVNKKNIYEKLLFMQAIDIINPFEECYNSEMRNYLKKDKTLNSLHTDKVQFYPQFKGVSCHKHSLCNSISSLFSNLCYVYVSNKYNVENHYFFDNYVYGKKFRVGLIPVDSEIERNYDDVKIDNRSYLIPTKEYKNKKELDLNYIYNELRYLVQNDVNMVILPETLDPLDDKIVKEIVGNSNVIIFGPTHYKFDSEDVKSVAKVHSKEVLPLNVFEITKVYPYVSKYGKEKNVAKMEKIELGSVFHVLHIKGFGKILLLICSDAFEDYVKQIINTMNVDCIAISSCTESYNGFNNRFAEEIFEKNRCLIQCNLCSHCFRTDKVISQINYSSMGTKTERDIVCKNACKRLCSKHFILDVDISDAHKSKIEEVHNDEKD